jgi:hypothetical protein
MISHEDGSVQFWDVTNISMPLIYKLKTNDYFQIEQPPNDDIDEETWPPFRKVRLQNISRILIITFFVFFRRVIMILIVMILD